MACHGISLGKLLQYRERDEWEIVHWLQTFARTGEKTLAEMTTTSIGRNVYVTNIAPLTAIAMFLHCGDISCYGRQLFMFLLRSFVFLRFLFVSKPNL
jgi:hypothetical protein